MDCKLFVRMHKGLRLTESAKEMMEHLCAMQAASQNLLRRARATGTTRSGYVRLAITDGLGIFWAVPKLVDFNVNSKLKIELICTNDLVDVSRLQADICVQFAEPKDPNVVAVKLGYLHTYPFVSTTYAQNFGVPKTIDEARNHRLVEQVSALIPSDIYPQLFGVPSVYDMVSVRTGTSAAVLYACERMGGMAFLPNYALALGAPLVPVDIGLKNRLDIWLSYHPDFKSSERHKTIIAWLRRIFDPKRYPCFQEEFIHPNHLTILMRGLVDDDRVTGYAAANLGGSPDLLRRRVQQRKRAGVSPETR
ncbi:MAG: hypothetical protein BGP06_09535 [Rhizobiales bacterium 65-9]|nr:MAG: hypothetical protein BGP06_09535 [Rhizobiales bacterium 65-9]